MQPDQNHLFLEAVRGVQHSTWNLPQCLNSPLYTFDTSLYRTDRRKEWEASPLKITTKSINGKSPKESWKGSQIITGRQGELSRSALHPLKWNGEIVLPDAPAQWHKRMLPGTAIDTNYWNGSQMAKMNKWETSRTNTRTIGLCRLSFGTVATGDYGPVSEEHLYRTNTP